MIPQASYNWALKNLFKRGIKIPEQFVWVLICPCIHKIILVEEIFGSGVFA